MLYNITINYHILSYITGNNYIIYFSTLICYISQIYIIIPRSNHFLFSISYDSFRNIQYMNFQSALVEKLSDDVSSIFRLDYLREDL